MKRTYKILAGLIMAAGIGGVALAQGGPRGTGWNADGAMGRHVTMKSDPVQRVERHLAMLKYQINVTDAQEPLWQAYAQKMKAEAGKGMQALRTQSVDEKLSAPERMAKMQSLMEERLVAMRGVHESFNHLYAALTPEQKAKADQFAADMGSGRKGGRGGRHGGPGRMMPLRG